MGHEESASITSDLQTFCLPGQNAEHHKTLLAICDAGGGVVAANVASGTRTCAGQQNRMGRYGNSRSGAYTGLGICDAIRRRTLCQPGRAEVGLGRRLNLKALVVSRLALVFGVLHCSFGGGFVYIPWGSEHGY